MGRNKIKCVPPSHLRCIRFKTISESVSSGYELMPAKKKRMNKKRVGSV